MEQAAFPISGLSSCSLYAALCQDALFDDRIVIGVAEDEKRIVAFLLIIVDWRAYWRTFLHRHPLLGVRIVGRRLSRRQSAPDAWNKLTRKQQEQITQAVAETPSGRSWEDSSPSIAKGVFLQVEPAFRRRGISVRLYHHMFTLLAERGVRRIDAKVDLANTGALPLHLRVGYHLERSGNTLFATRDLS